MEKIDLKPTKCIYRIVTGRTLKELEANINDIIAQGWNAEKFIGGVGKEDNGYYQTILICPVAKDSYNVAREASA